MRIILIVFSVYLSISNLFSQIVITDINKNPIPFVQIVSNNKYFFAQTNLKGEIDNNDIKKLKESDTLFFHHVSFEKEYKIKANLLPTDTIVLSPKVYVLKEFSISAKEKSEKYVLINACYRSYQANNDSMAYYTDGKVEYQSKIKKNDFKLFKKEYRAFTNTRLENEAPQRSVAVTFKPTIPRPPADYLPARYIEEHKLKQVPKKNGKIELYYKDNKLIGVIEVLPQYIKYSINDIRTNTTRKAFETEVNFKKIEVTMLFRNSGHSDPASMGNFDDLIYSKTLREYRVKHDKDRDYNKIFSVEEFFIENVRYSQALGDTEYTNGIGMPKSSSHSSEFWKTCNCEAYYPPQEQILRGLYKDN